MSYLNEEHYPLFQNTVIPVDPPALRQTIVYTRIDPCNGDTPVLADLKGHWVNAEQPNVVVKEDRDIWRGLDYWWQVTDVTDAGYWSQSGASQIGDTGCATATGCCSAPGGCPVPGAFYSCSPVNNCSTCYYQYYSGYGCGCIFCGCCSWFDAFALDYCGWRTYRAYYDTWNADWTTYYDILLYKWGEWVKISDTSVNTGSSPVYT